MDARSLLLLLVLQLSLLSATLAIEAQCSACFTVANELTELLTTERPHNHLDMRHRLDSRGQREGKVIDYKVSELRAVELLDGLCAKVKPYSLVQVSGQKKRSWTKHNENAKSGRSKMVAEDQGKELSRWCDRLLEEKEEELTSKIRSGELSLEIDVEDALCRNITRSCPIEEETAAEAKTTLGSSGDETSSGGSVSSSSAAESAASVTASEL